MKRPDPIIFKTARLDFLILAAACLGSFLAALAILFVLDRGGGFDWFEAATRDQSFYWLAGPLILSLAVMTALALAYYRLRRILLRQARDWERFGNKTDHLEQAVAERTASLLSKQRQIQSFLNNVEAGAYLKNERHEFTLVNPRLCAILGVSSRDLLNSTGYAVLPRVVAWRMVELEQQAAREGRAVELYDLFESSGYGHSRVYSLHLFPVLNPRGEIEGTGGMLIDVTERHRLSQAIVEAKDAAEKANLAKSAFLANISHEIRTPLNGIIGMSDVLLRGNLTADQESMVKTVKNAGYSLMLVLNDILDLSKIEAGKMHLESQPFNLRDLIFDTAAGQAAMAQNKALEVIVDLTPDLPELVSGDQTRIRQVILNLVSNALKFTPQGEVAVRVEILERLTREALEDDLWAQALLVSAPKLYASGREVVKLRFSVTDTGIGIPPEKLDIIFQPFEQADVSTTRTYGGTGLGLAICSRLLSMMGSTLNLKSQPDQGSVFWFDLNLPIDSGPPAPRRSEAARLTGRSVLAVEDNDEARRVLLDELEALGLAADAAAGADEALSHLRRAAASGQPFELVITDHLMPGKDGLDFLRELRAEPFGRLLPAILMTSAEQAPESPSSFAAILSKPVRPSNLAGAIAAALQLWDKDELKGEAEMFATPPQRCRILLVEDMEMNQTVAVRLLQELGHQVEVASNGRQALELLKKSGGSAFDLVLMDIQMPVMDGLETTARLKKLEAGNNWPHLPIAAMTAHAMKGDREKYLDLGLDDYIAKPILLTELAALINRLRDRRPAEPPAQAEPPAKAEEPAQAKEPPPAQAEEPAKAEEPPASPPLDEEVIRLSFGTNSRLLGKSMEIYMRDAPGLMVAIRAALEAGDLKLTAGQAHALKGISSYYTKRGPFELARRLDQAAKNGSWPDIKPELESLAAELDRSVADLTAAMADRLSRVSQ